MAYRYTARLTFQLIVVGIALGVVEIGLLPSSILPQEYLLILQSIIQLDGVLIGFVGVIAGLIISHDLGKGRLDPRGIALGASMVGAFFLFSVVASIYAIATTGTNPMQPSTPLVLSLYFQVMGVIRLFAFIIGIYPIPDKLLRT